MQAQETLGMGESLGSTALGTPHLGPRVLGLPT